MVRQWVKDLTESVLGPGHKIGDEIVVKGRKAKIISGQYWGEHGLSNHWTWEYLDGKEPKTESGYL